VSSFKKEYGIIPDQFAALAYDTTGVVIEALKVSGPDRAKLRDALAHIKDYPGVTGNTTFDENRDAKKGVLVLKIENGKFVFHTRV
jgi:branched-chain amino acid transport system substrate-binding protein